MNKKSKTKVKKESQRLRNDPSDKKTNVVTNNTERTKNDKEKVTNDTEEVTNDTEKVPNDTQVLESNNNEELMSNVHARDKNVKSHQCERDQKSSAKLRDWIQYQNEFLDEILRHDGKGDYIDEDKCYMCKKENALYKRKDCLNGTLMHCKNCIVHVHAHLPLHRIEKWSGLYFEKDSLKNLGLIIQLGHGGAACSNAAKAITNLAVVDITGTHTISVAFCDCRKQIIPVYVQLLRAKWFPASFIQLKTVFTFECLETFHELTLQGKTTLYDWYHTLCQKTDKCKLENEINHYNEFRHVVRMWRVLFMCKRGGRGQFTEGIMGTNNGELTVECPACPHPNKNLPDNWENTDLSLRFLYIMYLAIDVNFKLSCKERPYVEEKDYQLHLATHKENPEINTCDSEHDAILQAGIRSAPGHSVTGAALVICSRHSLIRRNGAGDLQKGECRYCNIDYIFLSTLASVVLPWIMVTYDIGCQWSKNLRRRIEEYPEFMKISPDIKIDIGVPSWHINGHGSTCCRAGRTCGEEVETTWSSSNYLRPSTHEMGPASHHELLNDHWIDWNAQKIFGFCYQKHNEIFEKFNATFSTAMTDKWKYQIKAWNDNHIGPNPYHETEHTTKLQDQKKFLKHKITLTKFILLAFELEEQILKLEVSKMKKNPTTKKQADLQDKYISLGTQIQKWQEVQLIYMPEVEIEYESTVTTELIPINLPSRIPMNLQKLPEIQKVANSEFQLCKAQAEDALTEIWHLLLRYKGFQNRVDLCAIQYRMAHIALLKLDPNREWQSNLHELKNEDISGPGKEPDDPTSNGRFEMSWIWLVPRASANTENNDNELDESLRIEWAKCHARRDRWAEEVLILKEEMRRVIQYLEWKAECSIGNDIKQGVKAYALKQASICQRLAQHCANWWIPAFQKQKYMPDWIHKYIQKNITDLEEEDYIDEQDDDDDFMEEQDEEEYMENLMDILEVEDENN
ncbi:hypothetical protein BDQ17DRAFT_1454822 [Cyathus striatus]|nr:hypothetical protein BDQ17DRAFT_1454822 [Cyathus striatus]